MSTNPTATTSSDKDPNTYKIRCTRYNYRLREEEVTLYQGSIRSQMEDLFQTVKTRQGSNLIEIRLEHKNGEVLERYP